MEGRCEGRLSKAVWTRATSGLEKLGPATNLGASGTQECHTTWDIPFADWLLREPLKLKEPFEWRPALVVATCAWCPSTG
eukprot:2578370-Pleurochrysis_carterae.AAC.2